MSPPFLEQISNFEWEIIVSAVDIPNNSLLVDQIYFSISVSSNTSSSISREDVSGGSRSVSSLPPLGKVNSTPKAKEKKQLRKPNSWQTSETWTRSSVNIIIIYLFFDNFIFLKFFSALYVPTFSFGMWYLTVSIATNMVSVCHNLHQHGKCHLAKSIHFPEVQSIS